MVKKRPGKFQDVFASQKLPGISRQKAGRFLTRTKIAENQETVAKKIANWYYPTYGKTGQKMSGDCKARPKEKLSECHH